MYGVGIVSLLHAFFDASFNEPKGSGFTSIGGFVGPLDAWKTVETAWEENLSYWGIGEFHLASIINVLGREKGALCALSFARIVGQSRLHGIGAALNDVDWNREKGSQDLDRYFACLGMLFDVLGQHTALEFPGDDVVIVIDRDMSDERKARALYAHHQKLTPQFKGFTVGDRRTYRALQCADLAAGRWRKAWFESEFGSGDQIVAELGQVGAMGRFVLRSAKARDAIAASLGVRADEPDQ